MFCCNKHTTLFAALLVCFSLKDCSSPDATGSNVRRKVVRCSPSCLISRHVILQSYTQSPCSESRFLSALSLLWFEIGVVPGNGLLVVFNKYNLCTVVVNGNLALAIKRLFLSLLLILQPIHRPWSRHFWLESSPKTVDRWRDGLGCAVFP